MPYTPTLDTRPNDLNPNNFNPAATDGVASQVELQTLYERPIPEQMWLFQRHMNYVGFATMLRMMGFNAMTSNPTVGHFEDPWNHDVVEVGSVVTPAAAAGESTVIALSAASHYDTPATVGGSGRQATYPVVGDVVELADRTQVYVAAKNVTVTPNQITLTPIQAADDITGDISASDEFSILYNLHAEGSGLPDGRVPRIIKYSNTLGVVKHSFGATGFELTNAVYHETIAGQPSSAGESIYVKIKTDELERFEKSKSGLLVFGQQVDNITSTTTAISIDVPIQGTEGFIEFAVTTGNIDTYTAGSYATTDFDTIANYLLDERSAASNDVIGWIGPDLFTEIENSFTTTLTQNLVHTVDRIVPGYARYMNEQYQQGLTADASDATLSFGYQAIRKNGFIFHMKRMSEFADIKRAGSSTYNYRKWGIWHPISWSRDLISGNNRPTIGYQYKGMGNYQRENIFGSLPGAGVGGDNTPFGKAVNENDLLRNFLISHCGFHGAVGNAIVVQQPA